MTTFDERERSYEKKFAMDEELRFKAEARRNKAVGQWAAEKLGLTGAEVDEYVKSVRKADLAEKGDDDVFRKIRKDFDEKGVKISDPELQKKLADTMSEVMTVLAAESKSKI